MTDYVYLKVRGEWHRGILGPLLRDGLGSTHRDIDTDPRCQIATKPDASRFDEPPADEPRHAACWQVT